MKCQKQIHKVCGVVFKQILKLAGAKYQLFPGLSSASLDHGRFLGHEPCGRCHGPAAPGLTSCSLPSDEHISTLLDLRGDVSKEVRHMVLEMMAQHPQVLPESYRPIFSTILVPAPELPFCIRKGKCA